MERCRDRVIDYYDGLAVGHGKTPALQTLQRDLASLTKERREVVRRVVVSAIDHGLHDFLFAVQENADFDDDIQIRVDGVSLAEESDGVQAELFTEDGWMARFSKFAEPKGSD